jgi:Dolichyl-phosphate-mannose-protein mannosyltransferase
MLCCWLSQALAARDFFTADAISYLDIANSCVAGHWQALVNGWWSPAFPFLLAICLKIFKPHPFNEALLLHVFAFVSLIAALASFEYFMAVFLEFRQKMARDDPDDKGHLISDSSIMLVGYSLFFWISTFLIPPKLEQPDILVFVLYLMASALTMQVVANPRESSRYILLGIVLGLGYLTKSVMFPLAFVFYLALLFQKDRSQIWPRLLLSMAVFAALCSPFVLALSKSKGRFTFSDVGVMAYRHVMGTDEPRPLLERLPKPKAAPGIGDFTGIIQLGTYPPWSDPSYGYRATSFRFNLRRQLNRTHIVLRYYFDLLVVQLGPLAAAFLALFFAGGPQKFARRFVNQPLLWLPALAGLAFYASMRVDGRFLAGYAIALFAACAAVLRVPDASKFHNFMPSLAYGVSLLLLAQVAIQAGHDGLRVFERQKHPDWQVAKYLQDTGIKNGDRAGYIGYALIDHAWAHLAGVRIAAEIPEPDVANFWASTERQRADAIDWIASTSAKVVITRNVPGSAMSMGWTQVGETDYYVLRISPRGTP